MPHAYNENTGCYEIHADGEYMTFKDGDIFEVSLTWDNNTTFMHGASWFEYVNLYIKDGDCGKMIRVNNHPIHTYSGWKFIAECADNVLTAIERDQGTTFRYFVEVVKKSLT